MFEPRKLRVFLCHASQDKPVACELYQQLLAEGWIDPWLDEERLLAGQDQDLEIEKAVEAADAVIVCLSKGSIGKDGNVHRELRIVLDVARTKPEGKIYTIPLRINKCDVPRHIRGLRTVDYYPMTSRPQAYQKLLGSLRTLFEYKSRTDPEFGDAVDLTNKELKEKESAAIRFELIGDFLNASRAYHEIKRIDPGFPRVDIKIKELERDYYLSRRRGFGPWIQIVLVGLLLILPGLYLYHEVYSAITSTPLITTSTITPYGETALTSDITISDTPVSPMPPGLNWSAGCINTAWKTYPDVSSSHDGCLTQPVYGFTSGNDLLSLRVASIAGDTKVYGMFVRVPSSGTINFYAALDLVKTGEVWMGLFAEPDIESDGLLFVASERNIYQNMPEQAKIFGVSLSETEKPVYEMIFSWDESMSEIDVEYLQKIVESELMTTPTPQKWLFIGYRLNSGYNQLNADFYKLKLSPNIQIHPTISTLEPTLRSPGINTLVSPTNTTMIPSVPTLVPPTAPPATSPPTSPPTTLPPTSASTAVKGVRQCSDGIDNDGDGLIDGADPQCKNANDNDESK